MGDAMTPETKARLKQLGAERRAKRRLAKDLDLTTWGIACDYLEEQAAANYEPLPSKLRLTGLGYLRYVPPDVVAWLAKRLPSFRAVIRAGPSTREVQLFRAKTLEALLDFLGLDCGKYFNYINERCYQLPKP